MSALLITTKLSVPPLKSRLVNRSRLTKVVTEGLEGKLTLVSAPAGFGKTTLVRQWLAHFQGKTAWLSLDEGDQNPVHFLTYLTGALRHMDSRIGGGMEEILQSSPGVSVEPIIISLINNLTGISEKITIVLDDYHSVAAREIDDILTLFIDHLPPLVHLVVITRKDPDFPLAKLRVRGELNEIRTEDLRFRLEETDSFFTLQTENPLPQEDIFALENKTEGWIAGLQLAAVSMRGRGDTSDFIRNFTGSHHHVMDYLLEEVINQLPGDTRIFLLSTSILDRFCAPLCDALLCDPGFSSQEMIENIEKANLFVVPLDNERKWYRYHHLFAQLLRKRTGDQEILELNRRASMWFEAHGFQEDSINHALAGEDYERAARLLELIWPEMDGHFQSGPWLVWAKKLPHRIFENRPVLHAALAMALMDVGEFDEGILQLGMVEKLYSHENRNDNMTHNQEYIIEDFKQFQSLSAIIALIYSYYYLSKGDLERTISSAETGLRNLPEDDYLRKGLSAATLGTAYWGSGRLVVGAEMVQMGIDNILKGGNSFFAIGCSLVLGEIMLSRGALRESAAIFKKYISLAEKQEETFLWVAGNLYLGLSYISLQQGDILQAETYHTKSREICEFAHLADWPYRACLIQGLIAESKGDFQEALELMEKAKPLYFINPAPDILPIDGLISRLRIKQGDIATGMDELAARGITLTGDRHYLGELEYITLARGLTAEFTRNPDMSRFSDIIIYLETLYSEAETGGRIGSQIEISLLLARMFQKKGEEQRALSLVEHALFLGRPELYITIFAEEGGDLIKMVGDIRSSGKYEEYCNAIIGSYNKNLGNTQSSLIEPLSTRELEVLNLISRGLSNNDICDRLFLAIDTVKGHNRRIFGKLQVRRRTEAVAKARKLGLI